MLFVAGMWFQDLFNYDFRRTEMCIIPYGTQMGEISLLRVQHRRRLAATSSRRCWPTRRVAEWYKKHGRHPVYAKGQDFPIHPFANPITSRLEGQPVRLKVIG